MNDTNAKKLIAYMREENECERKHERKMFRKKMQMNLQMYQVLSQNMVVHPQQFQFLIPRSYQQFNNVPQDHQHQQLHHSIKVFCKEISMPTVLSKIWHLIFPHHIIFLQKQMLLKVAIEQPRHCE